MVVVLRYVCLLALGGASILALMGATAETGQLLLAQSGRTVDNPEVLGFWILMLMAGISLFSVLRFMFSRAPTAISTWIKYNKNSLSTLILVVLIGGLFVVT